MHPQSHTSPVTRDSKQAKLKLTGPVLSPQRSNNGVLQVTLTAKRSMQKHKEMMRVIEVSTPKENGREVEGGGSGVLQFTSTNSITQLAEAQENDEGGRIEHTPGKWEGGGGRGSSVLLQVTLTA